MNLFTSAERETIYDVKAKAIMYSWKSSQIRDLSVVLFLNS